MNEDDYLEQLWEKYEERHFSFAERESLYLGNWENEVNEMNYTISGRRFDIEGGGRSAFYDLFVAYDYRGDGYLIRRWGKTGTKGQLKIQKMEKLLLSDTFHKLVLEKTREGYNELKGRPDTRGVRGAAEVEAYFDRYFDIGNYKKSWDNELDMPTGDRLRGKSANHIIIDEVTPPPPKVRSEGWGEW